MTSDSRLQTAEKRIDAINPGAPRTIADHGKIDPKILFGVSPHQESTKKQALDWVAMAPKKAMGT